MHENDIVYILKEDINPDELKYSLRSVDKNFPHRKVWFVGGHAPGLTPDGSLYHRQNGATKWDRVHSSLLKIIKCEDISKKFFLFNDDFFVLQRIDSEHFVNMVNGTLEKRVRDIKRKCGSSAYASNLTSLRQELLLKGFDAVSFAVHMPMLLDKEKVAKTLGQFNSNMFRSAYGNMSQEPYIFHSDVKIHDRENLPQKSWEYLSTTEDSFKNGKVGEYIRDLFVSPSRFENTPPPILNELYSEEGDDRYAEG